ncbi:unnamed protein product [Cuscuta campestris]|uniref:Albumin I chain a domain-containing protein n=2 Tax=Cuscuta sect. Cleistogrammica TaxID=1824901 RepID=A0A484NMU0_9ASTE|nr:hypothetical protein DM860_004438 [Cuscuta australis]VFR02430.1 unnamed protein product [Cuscuta campestris]
MPYSNQLAPLALFLLASSLVLRMGAAECNGKDVCSPFEMPPCGDGNGCRCIPWGLFVGQCIHPTSFALPAVAEKIGAHPNLCTTDGECLEKGSGNHCARFPNPGVSHGWCIDSSVAPNGLGLKMVTDN